MAAGDVQGIIDYDFNYEHPPLTKLAYGLAILPLPAAPLIPEQTSPNVPPARSLPQPQFHVARTLSAALGTLEVLALAVINPLAGLFLASQHLDHQVHQPGHARAAARADEHAGGAVLLQGQENPVSARHRDSGWLVLSAVALGLTAASKYTYCIVGLAIVADRRWQMPWRCASSQTPAHRPYAIRYPPCAVRSSGASRRRHLLRYRPALVGGSVRAAGAVGALPRRLRAERACQGRANFPFWQPLVWLLGPVPWHPGVFVVMVDTFIALLAGLGLSRLWRDVPGLRALARHRSGLPAGLADQMAAVHPDDHRAALARCRPGLPQAIWEPLLRC